MGSIISGTSNSLSQIIGTLGSGIGYLTFDKEFIEQSVIARKTKAHSIG